MSEDDTPHYLTREEVLRRLRRHLATAGYFGAQIELARCAGIAHASVSNVLAGRVLPGAKLLRALGLRKVVLYEVIDAPVPIPKRARSNRASSLLHVEPPPPVQGTRMVVHRSE